MKNCQHLTKLMLAAALAASASIAGAAESWMAITQPYSWASVFSGTVGTTPLSITAVSGGNILHSNPVYLPTSSHIWDNDATNAAGTNFPNNAGIYPASAKTATSQIVFNTNQVDIEFDTPVANPIVLLYSVDIALIDFSTTRTASGGAAVIGVVHNSSGVFNAAAQTFGTSRVGVSTPEGCPAVSRRACGVFRFSGLYKKITLSNSAPDGGIGLLVGMAEPVPAPVAVPVLAPAGLAGLALGVAGIGAWLSRRRKNAA